MRIALAVIISSLALSARAHQPKDGDVWASLGALIYRTDPRDHHFDSPFLFSSGLLVEGDVDDNGGLEIGLFYLHNPFSLERHDLILTERVRRIYITAGYRHWATEWFSGALALSSSYVMGDPKIVRNDFPDPKPKTSADDVTEYGLDISLQVEPWRKDRYAVVVDARYNYSLTSKKAEDSSHYGMMLSLKYFVQSRSPRPKTKSKVP